MKQILIFEHVPKAAGTTFIQILRSYYNSNRIFAIDGSHPEKSVDAFMAMETSKQQQFDLILGHGAYKLKHYISQPSICLTILREPVERIISHYYYVRQMSSHHLHKIVMNNKLSLHGYVTSGITGELENVYTERFSMLSKEEINNNPEQALAKAKNNLNEHFLVIGLAEKFNEFILLVKIKLGWRQLPFYVKENVTRHRPTKNSIPKGTLDAIRKHNALDLELYHYVKKRFTDEIKDAGFSFTKELKFFNQMNKVLKPYTTARLLCRRGYSRGVRALNLKKSS